MYKKHYRKLEESAFAEGRALGQLTGFAAGVITAAVLAALAALVWL